MKTKTRELLSKIFEKPAGWHLSPVDPAVCLVPPMTRVWMGEDYLSENPKKAIWEAIEAIEAEQARNVAQLKANFKKAYEN